jgi:hypothetical protein
MNVFSNIFISRKQYFKSACYPSPFKVTNVHPLTGREGDAGESVGGKRKSPESSLPFCQGRMVKEEEGPTKTTPDPI